MPQPPEYEREKDFTVNDGDDTDHAALNREFDGAAQSINAIRDNLALIQKDDGSLKNGIVGADQLNESAFDSFQGELNEKVQEAQAASAESTRSAVASAASAANAASSEQSAARSEENAASSAASAGDAAQYAFNGIYFGPHSSDPTLDPNGNPPTDGDFYYNTVAKTWRAYDAQTGRWVAPILSGQFKRQIYVATTDYTPGVTNVLTLPGDPQTARNIFIHFDGIFQQANTFALNGLDIELDAPIPVGVKQVEIAYIEAVTIMVTDALVTYPTRAAAAVAALRTADGQAYEIRADEDNEGNRTRGIVMSGVLTRQHVSDVLFSSVPTTFQAMVIVVTQPHMRLMQWNGTKYVRSPLGKMPGEYFYAHDPLGKITHGIQVRTDVTYNTADHPDLAEHLGVVGSTFVLPGDGRARVLRGADLGVGVDATLVDGHMQMDAVSAWDATVTFHGALGATVLATGFGAGMVLGPQRNRYRAAGEPLAAANSYDGFTIRTPAALSASETRVKSLVATLYMNR